jgi:hypothetical protein
MCMKSAWNNLRRWFKVGERLVWLQYGILALVILLPVLLPGYILTLDMVFTPHFPWPVEITNTYPLDVALWVLNQLLPGDVVQKIVLFAILILSGVGAHLLVKQLLSLDRTRQSSSTSLALYITPYFAGLLFAINPFVYARLMAGQWQVLLGYALLPFLVAALFRLLAASSWRVAWLAAAWMLAILSVSVHFVGVLVVLGVLFLVAAVVKYWKHREKALRCIVRMVCAGGVTLIFSSYWLVPALLGNGMIGEVATRADEMQFSAFATHGGPLGPVGEVLRLQGFWAETRQLFLLPQDIMPLWGVAVLLLWVLVGIGAVRLWRLHRPAALVMIGSIIAGVVLATSPLLQWLSQLHPLFGGYREPHKFTVLVVLGYSVLAAFGVMYLITKYKHKKIWATVCLVLPLLITPSMFWAGSGQLRSVDYPEEWYVLDQQLKNTVPPAKKVLFLPWHMYAPYSFSNGRIIANPAEKFFQAPVVISDDPEFANIAPNQHDTTKQQLAVLLDNPQNLTVRLQDMAISHVVLAKEQDWQEYDFLRELPKVHEDDTLIVYEVPQ